LNDTYSAPWALELHSYVVPYNPSLHPLAISTPLDITPED